MSKISVLPEKFIEKSYPLEKLGIKNLAWNYDDIFPVINYLTENGYLILGGDVYLLNDCMVESTYDSWYTQTIGVDKQILIKTAQTTTTTYIKNYHARNGNNYLYSLVFRKIIGSH